MEVSQDWSQFTKRIHIKASTEKVYACWTTRKELETWFLRTAHYYDTHNQLRDEEAEAQKGDKYLWEWHNWEGEERGELTEANGTDMLAFEFAEGTVRVSLSQDRNMTLVSLHQFDIPTDEDSRMRYFVGCSNGWTFWLANLKSYLEHGILLHERSGDMEMDESGMEFVNT